MLENQTGPSKHCVKPSTTIGCFLLGTCYKVEHTAALLKSVFDVHKPVKLAIPNTQTRDCSNFYGEHYVYAACNGRCETAECPLVTVTQETCNNHATKRVFALAANTPSPELVPMLMENNPFGRYVGTDRIRKYWSLIGS